MRHAKRGSITSILVLTGSSIFETTEISGRQVKQELKVGDRWLEFLKRDGTTGVVLDGQFMSVDDAQKKLAATAGSAQ